MCAAFPKDQFAKVFVVRDQNAVFRNCPCQDVQIGAARLLIENRIYIMVERCQPRGHNGSGTFIDKEPHLCRLHDQRHKLRPAQRFSGKQETGTDIVL